MNLKRRAQEALNDYHAEISAGGEPHYPEWAYNIMYPEPVPASEKFWSVMGGVGFFAALFLTMWI